MLVCGILDHVNIYHGGCFVTDTEHVDLQARARITDLIYRYAQNIRTGSSEACAGLFTEDATFEVREVIVEMRVLSVHGPGSPAAKPS
jgi:hypothetical protein